MRFRLRPGRSWLRLLGCIADGFRQRTAHTLRHITIINPFVRKTWPEFSFRVHGETFLKDMIEAGREAGMKPFLMWGTLLGLVREGGLIKHDKDIDVGILAQDWSKRHLLIEGMQRRGYILAFDRKYKIRFNRRDRMFHLDVDVFFRWEDKMVCLLLLDDGRFQGAWFPPHLFDSFRSCAFLGTEVLIPDPPEPILGAVYGDWRTPVKSYSYTGIPNWLELPAGTKSPMMPDLGA